MKDEHKTSFVIFRFFPVRLSNYCWEARERAPTAPRSIFFVRYLCITHRKVIFLCENRSIMNMSFSVPYVSIWPFVQLSSVSSPKSHICVFSKNKCQRKYSHKNFLCIKFTFFSAKSKFPKCIFAAACWLASSGFLAILHVVG